MFELYLFDLDQTLLETDDLEEIRLEGKRKGHDDADYRTRLWHRFQSIDNRHIYSPELLAELKAFNPNVPFGVVTRSPRVYAENLLHWAYPDFEWDVIVAYEDVNACKPDPECIFIAIGETGVEQTGDVLYVGDDKVDIATAYHAGCRIVLDKSSWPKDYVWDHWKALEMMPDAIISSANQLIELFRDPFIGLPELERLLEDPLPEHVNSPRYDSFGYFIPKALVAKGKKSSRYAVFVCGRSFSLYEALEYRRNWHTLSHSIQDNKGVQQFPTEWIQAVYSFVRSKVNTRFLSLFFGARLVISVVPHRPEREPRLEHFLDQLRMEYQQRPVDAKGEILFVPDLLAYKAGVVSNHGEHLNAQERFENVRDHLFVKRTDLVNSATMFLIIDDVVTTGASFIYSFEYLKAAGANEKLITCLALAKAIGDSQ